MGVPPPASPDTPWRPRRRPRPGARSGPRRHGARRGSRGRPPARAPANCPASRWASTSVEDRPTPAMQCTKTGMLRLLALAQEGDAHAQVHLARRLVVDGGQPQEGVEGPGVGALLLHVHAGPHAVRLQAVIVVQAGDAGAEVDEVGDPVEGDAGLREPDRGSARRGRRASSRRSPGRRPRSTSSPCPGTWGRRCPGGPRPPSRGRTRAGRGRR